MRSITYLFGRVSQLGDPRLKQKVPMFKCDADNIPLRLGKLSKWGWNIQGPRKAAINLIFLKTQMQGPSDGMSLLSYFKPAQNVLVNKGAMRIFDSVYM